MRYPAILLGVAVVALGAVGTSVGAQAQQFDIHLDDHFQDDSLSEACGVDVIAYRGNHPSREQIVAATCAALTDP